MIPALTATIIATAALYLVGFGSASFLAPAAVGRFLLRFASSALAHYAELGVRVAVGAALIHRAPTMLGGEAFRVLGWILVGTTVALACLPWQMHRRIAERAVPRALAHLKLMGLAALAAGAALLVGMLSNP